MLPNSILDMSYNACFKPYPKISQSESRGFASDSVRPACTWCVVPLAAKAAPVAASWHEIVMAPDLRFSPRCFVLAAASEWCRMERRIAQRYSSLFWRKLGYMQASGMLGPVLADDVCGGSLVHGNCTIAPQAHSWHVVVECRMSGDGQGDTEDFHAICHGQVDTSNRTYIFNRFWDITPSLHIRIPPLFLVVLKKDGWE